MPVLCGDCGLSKQRPRTQFSNNRHGVFGQNSKQYLQRQECFFLFCLCLFANVVSVTSTLKKALHIHTCTHHTFPAVALTYTYTQLQYMAKVQSCRRCAGGRRAQYTRFCGLVNVIRLLIADSACGFGCATAEKRTEFYF